MVIMEIPLIPEPQLVRVTLGVTEYIFRLTFADSPEGGWVLDIADAGGAPLASGLPLITGADLLGQLRYLGIPGQLFVYTDGEPDQVPAFSDLGVGSHLYHVTQ